MDEGARLRTNVIIATFLVSCFYIGMLIADITSFDVVHVPTAAVLGCTSFTLFLIQFFRKEYSAVIAWLFGAMAWAMSVDLIYTGGMGGYSFLWVFLVPHIAVMVVNLRGSIIYNSILLVIILLLLHPLHEHLAHQYDLIFRILFPIAIFFVMMLGYVAEGVRYKTQRQLQHTAQKLQAFAFTDPLTGVYNRRALTSHFGEHSSDAMGLSFAMLDLDHFKRVNDRFGHSVGDQMLQHVVQRIGGCVPPNALLYRWGGEEFLLALKTADAKLVVEILENIRWDVEASPLRTEGQIIPMTISIGAACATCSCRIDECIERADAQLYAAKEGGRNRVMIAREI